MKAIYKQTNRYFNLTSIFKFINTLTKIVCIGWISKKCFDTVDAWCKHEECSSNQGLYL